MENTGGEEEEEGAAVVLLSLRAGSINVKGSMFYIRTLMMQA